MYAWPNFRGLVLGCIEASFDEVFSFKNIIKYKGVDLLSTGQLFQFFQDGFDYTSTSGLRFSTVSGSLRLQFRLLASGPRFEKISALRAASSLKKKAL